MKDRVFKYSIYNKNVYLELFYKGVAMNYKRVYTGKSKKDCENWIKEKGNKKYVKENWWIRKNSYT